MPAGFIACGVVYDGAYTRLDSGHAQQIIHISGVGAQGLNASVAFLAYKEASTLK